MNREQRLQHDLPSILGSLASGPYPEYIDDVLATTAQRRQRPVWAFPGRWLPMDIATRAAPVARMPWRQLGVLALISLLIVAAIAAYVGTQQQRLPKPFGPAANGVIPFVSGGDLYVGDPVTGTTQLLVGGPETDALPQFSPDGTEVAFIRDAGAGGVGAIDIYVARGDGSGSRKVNPEPISDWHWIGWTPDGQRLAVIHEAEGVGQLDLYDADANGSMETLATQAGMDYILFRPPDGQEILYRGLVDGKWGIFAMDLDGTNVRTIVEPTVPESIGFSFGGVAYSADGERVFYQRGISDAAARDGCCQLWVVNSDGSDAHEFVHLPGLAWTGQPVVSPDGTRVAFWHNPNDGPEHGVSVVRSDGTGPVIETGPAVTGTAHWVWAPDSSKILMYVDDDSSPSAYLLDPDGGPWTTVPWRSDGDLDWQRVALPD